MEKKMEKMRNEIVGQNKFYGAIAALGIAMIGMMSSGMIDNAYSLNEHYGDFMHGFVLGIVLVMEFYAVSGIGKNLKALKDEKKLARLYMNFMMREVSRSRQFPARQVCRSQ